MRKLRFEEVNFPKVIQSASGRVGLEPKQLDLQVSTVSLSGNVTRRKEPGSSSHPLTLGKPLSFWGTLYSSFKKKGVLTKGSLSFPSVFAFPKSRSLHFFQLVFIELANVPGTDQSTGSSCMNKIHKASSWSPGDSKQINKNNIGRWQVPWRKWGWSDKKEC